MNTEEHNTTDKQEENIEETSSETTKQERKGISKYFGKAGIIGIVLGGIAGYLYYYYIGCRSGGCPINSNPYFSILWGAAIGYLFGDMFSKKPSKKR